MRDTLKEDDDDDESVNRLIKFPLKYLYIMSKQNLKNHTLL